MTHQLPNGYEAVTVPEDSSPIELTYSRDKVVAWQDGSFTDIDLPSSGYTLIGRGDEVTEKQAESIMEKGYFAGKFCGWKSFTLEWLYYSYALEAFHSLLASLSLNPKTTMIIKKESQSLKK